MNESSKLINFLTKQDPDFVYRWLHETWRDMSSLPPNFAWKQLAAAIDVLAKTGQANDHLEPDLEWAKIALLIYDFLIEKSQGNAKEELQDRAMELKVCCILSFGPVEQDSILSVKQVISWFFDNLHLSIDEAKREIEMLEKLDIIKIVSLRNIKNRLLMLQFLKDRNYLPFHEELFNWLAIRDKLP